jgi:hypothetical protein
VQTRIPFPRFLGIVFVVILFSVLYGCSNPMGTITGRVTLKGEPLGVGSVNFVSADGGSKEGGFAIIQPDGTYTATIPTGKMKIFISAPKEVVTPGGAMYGSAPPGKAMSLVKKNVPPKDFAKPKDAEIPDNYFPKNQKYPKISSKYQSPDSSSLILDVKSGENKFDIPLD